MAYLVESLAGVDLEASGEGGGIEAVGHALVLHPQS